MLRLHHLRSRPLLGFSTNCKRSRAWWCGSGWRYQSNGPLTCVILLILMAELVTVIEQLKRETKLLRSHGDERRMNSLLAVTCRAAPDREKLESALAAAEDRAMNVDDGCGDYGHERFRRSWRSLRMMPGFTIHQLSFAQHRDHLSTTRGEQMQQTQSVDLEALRPRPGRRRKDDFPKH